MVDLFIIDSPIDYSFDASHQDDDRAIVYEGEVAFRRIADLRGIAASKKVGAMLVLTSISTHQSNLQTLAYPSCISLSSALFNFATTLDKAL
jgi:hypothetical protein